MGTGEVLLYRQVPWTVNLISWETPSLSSPGSTAGSIRKMTYKFSFMWLTVTWANTGFATTEDFLDGAYYQFGHKFKISIHCVLNKLDSLEVANCWIFFITATIQKTPGTIWEASLVNTVWATVPVRKVVRSCGSPPSNRKEIFLLVLFKDTALVSGFTFHLTNWRSIFT